MRKLSCGKDLQSRASQLGSDTCKYESYRNVRVLNLLACHFLVNIIIIIIYELICAQLNMRMISCALQLHYFTRNK